MKKLEFRKNYQFFKTVKNGDLIEDFDNSKLILISKKSTRCFCEFLVWNFKNIQFHCANRNGKCLKKILRKN